MFPQCYHFQPWKLNGNGHCGWRCGERSVPGLSTNNSRVDFTAEKEDRAPNSCPNPANDNLCNYKGL